MPAVKAMNFLKSSAALPPVVCLWGDGYTLGKLALAHVYQRWPEVEDQDKATAETPDALMGCVEEGSIFGRILEIKYEGDWKSVAGIRVVLNDVENDRIIIRCSKAPPDLPLFSVDCSNLARKDARERFLGFRKAQYGLELAENIEDTIIARSVNVDDVENTLQRLSLFVSDRRVTLGDLDVALPAPETRGWLMRSILTSNTPMLIRELNRDSPIPTLYSLHRCFFRLYTYAEADKRGETEDAVEILKIAPYEVKEWRLASKEYQPQKLRELMELCYSTVRRLMSGKTDGWRERLLLEIQIALNERVL